MLCLQTRSVFIVFIYLVKNVYVNEAVKEIKLCSDKKVFKSMTLTHKAYNLN